MPAIPFKLAQLPITTVVVSHRTIADNESSSGDFVSVVRSRIPVITYAIQSHPLGAMTRRNTTDGHARTGVAGNVETSRSRELM